MQPVLIKYPRTPHLAGSRLQPGDEDMTVASLRVLEQKPLVIEEKVDGANVGISFDANGKFWIQSRGHFLLGGPREIQFELLKAWVATHQVGLHERLTDRYTMYGEWLYAFHTVFYDNLSHYFLEFDILDREAGVFLSTDRRKALLEGLPVRSVPVLFRGKVQGTITSLDRAVKNTNFKTAKWLEVFGEALLRSGIPFGGFAGLDYSDEVEGLYCKIEDEERVVERYKHVRATFSSAVQATGSHWADRPIIPNQLREGVDIFASTLPPLEDA